MSTTKRSKKASTPPSRDTLHEAALAYLSRTASSAASLARVLERKVDRWARGAAREGKDAELIESTALACRESIETIVARFREVGLLNDAAFARSRAQSLSRAGRSHRAIAAHLTKKGVASSAVRDALPVDASVELDRALTFARKRRLGPYAREPLEPTDRAGRQKELAAMARAGFDWSTCTRALCMDRSEADDRLASSRIRD